MPSSMETGVKQVHIVGTDGQIPMQQASQLTPFEKLQTSYSVGIGVTSTITATPIDMDGFNTLGVGVIADLSHAWVLGVLPSVDGTSANVIYADYLSVTSTGVTKGGVKTAYMPYYLIQITNNDTVAHTYSIWDRKLNL